jgi:DNA-binding NtrC family response regulator
MISAIPILIVSGEQSHRDMLASSVSRCGLLSVCCGTSETAAALLSRHPFYVVICDDTLPDGTFRTVIDHAARYAAGIPVIVTSHLDDWELFIEALNVGAFDYIASRRCEARLRGF